MIAALLMSAALAADPAGFRVGTDAVNQLGIRQALVMNSDEPWLSQSTFAGRVILDDRMMIDVGLPAVYLWEPGADGEEQGLGQAFFGFGGYWSVYPGRRHQLELELYLPTSATRPSVAGWGSLARETLPGFAGLFAWEHSWTDLGRGPFTIRLATGVWSANGLGGPIPLWPVFEVVVVKVFTVTDRVALVAEAEATVDRSPATLRTLGRLGGEHLSLDLGVQLPSASYSDSGGPVQIIGATRVRF